MSDSLLSHKPISPASAPTRITSTGLLQFMDISPDALVIVNQAGTIVMVNSQAEAVSGYARSELLGQRLEILLPHRFREVHIAHRKRYFSAPLARPMGAGLQLSGRRKDGTEFPVDISLRPLLLDDVPHVIGAIRDVTEQKALEEQNRLVQKANRLKSEFLANMSHELRTPLNGIIGFAEMLYDEVLGLINDEQRECLANILSCSKHLLQLINDVLDLTKVEAGKMVFLPEPVELDKLVGNVCDILRPLSANKQLQITTEIASTITTVVIDPAKFKQLLYNYLSNAIKFTPDGGKICIRITPEPPDAFRLEVEDTGIGVRSEDLKRLFVEFQQLDISLSKKYQGTGLGLALTKRLVEAQGGRVGAHSMLGKGSTFFAVLPRVTKATLEPHDEQSYGLPEVFPDIPSILIIDDDAKDRERLVQVCTEAGYNVDVAVTGAQALEKCRQKVFGVITLDLILPDMDGWDVLRAIRARGLNRDVPIIIITVVKEKGVGAGFAVHDILSKPVQARELLSTLERLKRTEEPEVSVRTRGSPQKD